MKQTEEIPLGINLKPEHKYKVQINLLPSIKQCFQNVADINLDSGHFAVLSPIKYFAESNKKNENLKIKYNPIKDFVRFKKNVVDQI